MARLRILIAAMALTLLAVAIVLAVDVEVGDDSGARPGRPMPVPEPPDEPAAEAIRELIDSVRVGDPETCGEFQIFPLLLDNAQLSTRMLTLDEALEQGAIEIIEQGSGSVPTLLATNRSRRYIFLMAGEMILGGRQNRIIRQDMILPPGIRKVEIPVYCGQQGRWTQSTATFGSRSSVANMRVRKRIIAQRPQSEVWRGIDENLRGNSVGDASRSLQSVFEDESVQRRIERMVDRCLPIGNRKTVGIAVAFRGRVLGVDLFGNRHLFRELATKILKTYAVEVFDADSGRGSRIAHAGRVEEYLSRMGDAFLRPIESPGAGQAFLMRFNGSEGSALVFGSQPVHLAAVR